MMKKKHIIEQLPDYLDGHLSEEENQKVALHLAACETCSQEAISLKQLFEAFEKEESKVPPLTIKTKFLDQLEAEKHSLPKIISLNKKSTSKRKTLISNLLKVAASILLLFGAFLAGTYRAKENSSKEIASLTEEKQEFRQTAMLSLMENESASKRIQGVNYIEGFKEPDVAIVKALTDRMLYDKNTNVRLAAVEALQNFADSEMVKNGFIEALKIEKDPSIQITIIHTLADIHEKKAIEPMRRLLQQEETQPFIKNQIESILPNII